LLVFGAVGPIERLLLLDEIGESALSEAYARQAEALAAGGADAILCRSFVEVGALVVAIRAAIQATGLPVIGSMTFDSGPEQVETALGTTVPQACAEMAEAGAAVVGCDCGDSPDSTPAVVSLIRQSCGLPIWVKVDAGLPELVEGRVVYPETPPEFAGRLESLVQEGANFVGGCCGASAGHVAALATIRNQPRRKQR
jgi:methionine synthase I (cobalamin-dependent)